MLHVESCLLHLLWSLQLVIVEEVDQVSLTGLQSHFTRELVDAQFLDDLKQICFTSQFRPCIFLKPLLAGSLLAATTEAA